MYRIIKNIYLTQAEAEREKKAIKSKVKNPQVVYSPKTNCWILELYHCEDRNDVEQAYLYYRKLGIEMNIQKYE